MSSVVPPISPARLSPDRIRPLVTHLSALQLSDSAFPSGRYNLSYGLEAIAQAGHLAPESGPSAFVCLLTDCIRFGVAPSDGVALACAHRAVDAEGFLDLELVAAADERLTAVKLTAETRGASTRTGRALLASATAAFGELVPQEYADRVNQGRSPGNHAVVQGLLSARLGLPRPESVAGDLYAFSASWVAAAVRLSLLDHRGAQAVLYQVHRATAAAALEVVDRSVMQISSCTPLLDVMAMRHEEAELRMFAS